MNIIFLFGKKGRHKTRTLQLTQFTIWWGLCLIVLSIGTIAFMSFRLGTSTSPQYRQINEHWQATVSQQADEIQSIKTQSKRHILALSQQLGNMEAELLRLNALGQQLVRLSDIDPKEFNFTHPPAVGGPTDELFDKKLLTSQYIEDLLNKLNNTLHDHSKQLITLEKLLSYDHLSSEIRISGRPTKGGWISSYFGQRVDPFTGRNVWHKGIDIAGKQGSPIIASGSGIITWASERHGYGLLVEINHGNGLITRYGHNAQVLVEVGQVVDKGDVISLMGTSGRSTGPHVHYEVLKNGRAVNPMPYITRKG